ncbi:Uncharacterised protein [Bordetella pertussis]|nr:Uncharacterised protein [Bordetella pertussis]
MRLWSAEQGPARRPALIAKGCNGLPGEAGAGVARPFFQSPVKSCGSAGFNQSINKVPQEVSPWP